jgi:hypothetical protein
LTCESHIPKLAPRLPSPPLASAGLTQLNSTGPSCPGCTHLAQTRDTADLALPCLALRYLALGT